MTDQQRADSVLPGHPSPMPYLDRFAAEGLSFQSAYCPSPHCCPSRASFFTSVPPSRHGVWNNILNAQALSTDPKPGTAYWSEILAESGYAMHYSGKWHVAKNSSPSDHGWKQHFTSCLGDTYHGNTWHHYATTPGVDPDLASRRAGEIFYPYYGNDSRVTLYQTHERSPMDHDQKVAATGVELIESLSQHGDTWCLYLGFFGPHDPYNVPSRYVNQVPLDRVALPPNFKDPMLDKPGLYRRMATQLFGQLSPEEHLECRRHYYAYCSYMDALFGKVLQALDHSGQTDHTVVIFLSDHGDYAGEHGLWCKGIPAFRSAYHIPLVMRWPAGIKKPGSHCNALVSLMDIGTTLLDLAEVSTEYSWSGKSLLPFLRGEAPADWRTSISMGTNGVELYATQRSVLTDRWKYTWNGFDFDELYNLENDPHEIINLAQHPAYRNSIQEMCRLLWQEGHRENDAAICSYFTVGTAPFGPGLAFVDQRGQS
jgi:arylsulfatase A-like enzyme